MRRRTSLITAVLAASAVFALVSTASAQAAAQAKGSTTPAARSRGTATDENIKKPRAANDPAAAAIPAPANKGGNQTRGAASVVHLDNWTNYYIDLYVNGEFCATSGPWGDAYCLVPSGSAVLYGKANFTDGSSLTWGPRAAYVDGNYDWKLTP
ncbi:MAG TPA: hypothetical protein VKQ05_00705 [Gemmatimonadales bacterium]|nr:hypothetical protein [Gemmatimonadales bacterium]